MTHKTMLTRNISYTHTQLNEPSLPFSSNHMCGPGGDIGSQQVGKGVSSSVKYACKASKHVPLEFEN
jgi:hypothetical protein